MASTHAGGIKAGFQLPFIDTVEKYAHGAHGVHVTPRPIIIAFIISVLVFSVLATQQSIYNFELFFFTIPLWLPIILAQCVRVTFQRFTRQKDRATRDYVLLEIRIPRDVTKTPLAMETVFANLHIGSGETHWYKTIFQGGTRPVWSCEIVSLGGRLHFYIRTTTGYRRLVESFLYGQYPDIEIIEAEDYSRLVDPSEQGYGMFATEFSLGSAPLNDAYPLRTYIDYGMEPGDKPEETVDPLGQLLETIGSIGPQEQFWIQIIFRQTKKEKYQGLVNEQGKPYGWGDVVKEAISALRSETIKVTKRIDPITGAVTETESFPNPSKGVTDMIAAVERKANKQIFDVGIRAVYLAPEDAYQGIMIPGMLSMFKPFNSERYGNRLGVIAKWTARFNDFPWEDRKGHHKHHYNKLAIQMYRRREYFYYPYTGPWMNLSSEELATLFHVPSAAVTTPNIERIQSSTSSAPSNLPS